MLPWQFVFLRCRPSRIPPCLHSKFRPVAQSLKNSKSVLLRLYLYSLCFWFAFQIGSKVFSQLFPKFLHFFLGWCCWLFWLFHRARYAPAHWLHIFPTRFGTLPTEFNDLFYVENLDLVLGRDGTYLDLHRGGGRGGDFSLLGVMRREEEEEEKSYLFWGEEGGGGLGGVGAL